MTRASIRRRSARIFRPLALCRTSPWTTGSSPVVTGREEIGVAWVERSETQGRTRGSQRCSRISLSSTGLKQGDAHAASIVSRQEWLKVRGRLLEREKAWTRQRDQIAAERLALPWVRIEKDYVFAGPQGKLTLSDLFQGRSQAYIKHFMMAPGAQHQCVGCSLEVDHIAGIMPRPREPRRQLCRGRPRAHRGDRSGAQAHGLDIPLGLLVSR